MPLLLRRLMRSLLLSLASLALVLSLIFAGVWLLSLESSSLSKLLFKTVSPPLNSLYGVAALSASNVWAVGETSLQNGTQPLIERWDGVTWNVTASPPLPLDPFRSFHRLKAVSARSSNDIWAVGCSDCDNASTIPLIEHWDGASWKVIPSEKQNVRGSLNGVSVLSPTNAWAVGSISNNGQDRPLLEQWNGATWQVLSHPGESFSGHLNGVAALSPQNVWVVGDFFDHGTMGLLIEHWDGAHWEIVIGPGTIRKFSSCRGPLYAITALSAQDIWTGGTCLLQWNGAIWQLRGGPQMQAPTWYAIAGTSPDALWIASQSDQSEQVVLGQWNGKAWKAASADISRGSKLFGVAMSSAQDVWVVGETSSASKILLLHWRGESWQLISGPNPGLPQQAPISH